MAQIRLYTLPDWKGDSKDFTGATSYVGDDFNDRTQSFEVMSGTWQLYADGDFQNPAGRTFGPGEKVNWVEAVGISKDSISSLQPV
jgi:hypothetical protein